MVMLRIQFSQAAAPVLPLVRQALPRPGEGRRIGLAPAFAHRMVAEWSIPRIWPSPRAYGGARTLRVTDPPDANVFCQARGRAEEEDTYEESSPCTARCTASPGASPRISDCSHRNVHF